jgi:hypothetical protein
MNNDLSRPVPSSQQLLKASGIAAAIAVVVLTVAVLPAEYGVDPLGVGKALGLSKLYSAEAEPEVESTAAVSTSVRDPVSRREVAYKTEERSIVLAPNKGAEIKAVMQEGDAFVFNWKSDSPVNFDMHGEPFGAKDNEFTSYWKDVLKSESHGAFTAPFGGTHGWYWRNRGAEPITVTVTVSGYFEKLYMP